MFGKVMSIIKPRLADESATLKSTKHESAELNDLMKDGIMDLDSYTEFLCRNLPDFLVETWFVE